MVAALMLGIGGHLVALTVDFAIGPVVGRADTGFGEQVSDEIVRIGQLIPHLWQECGAAATTVRSFLAVPGSGAVEQWTMRVTSPERRWRTRFRRPPADWIASAVPRGKRTDARRARRENGLRSSLDAR